uniref:Uncharacterized protein n=1 Tax=Lepeophtheirus salmonis TaxID=72036 RepID=A0A0K2TZQ2_LEPSM
MLGNYFIFQHRSKSFNLYAKICIYIHIYWTSIVLTTAIMPIRYSRPSTVILPQGCTGKTKNNFTQQQKTMT